MNRKGSQPRLSETLSALADEFVARLDRLHKAGDINDNAAECLDGLSEGMASLLRETRRRENMTHMPRRRATFQTQVLEVTAPWGWSRHLKVQRVDGGDGITWDELQRIKDERLGPEATAVEFYPPAHRVVDELNMRHLWEVPQDLLPMKPD